MDLFVVKLLKNKMENIMKKSNGNVMMSKKELRVILEGNGFIKNNKWSKWVLLFFGIVPEGKFIARKFIQEVLVEWGYGERFARNSALTTTLTHMVRDGFLERESLVDPACPGEKGFDKAREFWEKNGHGPVSFYENRTWSVFSLTEKGRKRMGRMMKDFAVREKIRRKVR